MAERYDAIIIGAGIIGAAIGYSLAKRGWKTLNIDKLPAAGYGPTAASCAIIRTHYSTKDGAAIAHEGWFYWKDWPGYIGAEDERGLAEYYDTGCMVMKSEHNNQLATIIANMQALGIPYEEWDPATIQARLPAYDLHKFTPVRRPDDPGFGQASEDLVTGAVFFPRAGYVSDPQLATHNIQRGAEAVGGAFRFNATVTAIRQQDGKVTGVTLGDGSDIDSPVVVNVSGPYAAKINGMAGVLEEMNIGTKALRQEVTHVPAPGGFALPFVTSDSDIGCYCRPETGNHILVGSEDPECDEREWVDPDDFNEDFTEQWGVQAQRYAQRLPSLGIPNQARGVVSLYDVSDDWIPIYDKTSLGGYYMAVGTSGNQFKNAPVAGELMAEIIERCQQGHDHDAEPVQFDLKHTGQTIDLGFYSRKREINQESSFSVLG